MVVVGLLVLGPLLNVFARPLSAIAPGLGTLTSFAILGGSTVTNTGPTVVNGDLGLWPGLSVTGFFPPGIVVPPGTIHQGDAVANQAQNDLTTAYNALAIQPCNVDLTGQDLGGLTLTPGVYCFSSSAQLTGALTLNALGDPNAVWVFQIGSTLTTASGSSILFVNGPSGVGCNLFWQVGSSTTLGTTTAFKGNILTLASITVNTSASLDGRALARNAAVTLDSNRVTPLLCAGAAATDIPLPATQTAIALTASAVAPTLTAIALTPTPTLLPATQTAIAATVTSIALTHTAIAPSLTAVAVNTLFPVLTATAGAGIITQVVPHTRPGLLPNTGFGPGHETVLSAQPADGAYAELGDLWLEIPRLGIQIPIVGVPKGAGGWDVSWLGGRAGWLNGSAFPTWPGNSVLTGHVYDAYGKPGPFVRLNSLTWGDSVIVHAWGAQDVFAIRQVAEVGPGATSWVFRHEDLPWVTLITCRGYDETSNSYKYRVVVRAVLVQVGSSTERSGSY